MLFFRRKDLSFFEPISKKFVLDKITKAFDLQESKVPVIIGGFTAMA